MQLKFPKDFYWGSATSGPQTEGDKDRGKTIWDFDYEKSAKNFFQQKNVKGDLYNKYEEYAQLAEEANFNSLRTSIQWSRLMPDGKNISDKAVTFYRNYFTSLKNKNIKVFAALFHFDMPMWAMELGGWTSRVVVEKFALFSKKAFELFGDLVDKWFTFNEAIVPIECQYLYKYHYPYEVDTKKMLQALWNVQISHHLVVNTFKSMSLASDIGIILNITPAIPRSESPEDVEAAEWAAMFQYKALLDSMINGIFPQKLIDFAKENNLMWEIQEGDDKIMNTSKMDILGVNYYQPVRVKAIDDLTTRNNSFVPNGYFYEHYDMPGRIINEHRGWEIYPKGIYDSLILIKEQYGNIKTFIAENGMGVEGEEKFKDTNGVIQDKYRIDFLRNHLEWVHKAIEDGVNCKGYHIWTYIDNWSWLNAYKNRYGIYELNIDTGYITAKHSRDWIKNLYKTSTLEIKKSH